MAISDQMIEETNEGGSIVANNIPEEIIKERRRLAIKLSLSGIDHVTISALCEIPDHELDLLLKTYREHGWNGAEVRPVSIRSLRRKLSQEQEIAIRNMMLSTLPEEHGFPEILWNQQIASALILEQCNIHLSSSAVKVYLKRWGLIPRRALKKAYDRMPNEVRHWMRTEYPLIAAQARQRNAEVLWTDMTPIANASAESEQMLLSLVNNKGTLQWLVSSTPITIDIAIDFLDHAIHGRMRKLFLISSNDLIPDHARMSTYLLSKQHVIDRMIIPAYIKMKNDRSITNPTPSDQ